MGGELGIRTLKVARRCIITLGNLALVRGKRGENFRRFRFGNLEHRQRPAKLGSDLIELN